MQVHGLITLAIRAMLHEAGITAFDLDTASCFLLDVLDVSSTVSDDLRSQVEALDGFKVNWDSFFGPFATTKFVTLDLLWFSASKSSLIHEIG